MARDRKLAPNFWLHEFPCWELATEADVSELARTVRNVLQPARERWGRIVPTSWSWWKSGCTPRTGAHGHPGSVDFVPLDTPVPTVHRWAAKALAGSYGEIIDERDHIHVTAPGIGAPLSAPQVLVEPSEGVYVSVDPDAGFPGGWGSFGRPFELEGLTVSVPGRSPWVWALAGGLLLVVLGYESRAPRVQR